MELFADHLASTFKPWPGQMNSNNCSIHDNKDNTPIKLIIPTDIAGVIKRQATLRKASGYDQITGEILKELPKKRNSHSNPYSISHCKYVLNTY